MRILHVARSLRRETGGLAECVRTLAMAQRARGDEVTVVSLDPADAGTDLPGLHVRGSRSHGYGFSPDYERWLAQCAPDFDVVLVHGLWQFPGWGTWRALRGRRLPYVVFCHGMLDPWFKRTYPAKHLKKWLYWPWAEYRVLRDAAAVCFTAEEERLKARESFWLYRARERVTPIGIPDPAVGETARRVAFEEAYPQLRGVPYLLFLGRIHPKKGVRELLQGYAAQPCAGRPRLVIAGPCADSGFQRALEQEAAQLGVAGEVVWLPFLSGAVKWGALLGCEAFVLFSHQENFGIAVVEALACGRPVLISRCIDIHGEIARDCAGLVGDDSAAGAADVLARWSQLGTEQRQAMSAAARRSFLDRFEVSRAADVLADVLAEVVRR